MKKCDFNFGHYESILKIAKKKGFEFLSFTKKNGGKKIIYLRHDVDVSLSQALKIAEIDKKNKVRSTFFVRSHANFYNPVSENSIEAIKKICALGHEIGLHYDGDVDLKNINALVALEHAFLKRFFNLQRVVSFHRPGPEVLGLSLENFVNTYEPYFFLECEYISDSNRELKKGCIREFIEKTLAKKVQVLTHPIWWNEKGLSSVNVYRHLLQGKTGEFRQELKNNIKNYQGR